jgi:hypothetical protein
MIISGDWRQRSRKALEGLRDNIGRKELNGSRNFDWPMMPQSRPVRFGFEEPNWMRQPRIETRIDLSNMIDVRA